MNGCCVGSSTRRGVKKLGRLENAENCGTSRILLNDDQHRRLAVKGKLPGRKRLEEVGTLFTPDTILRWHRMLVDITNLEAPQLIRTFQLSGNPDVPYLGDGFVLVPAGYQGPIRFEYR